MTLRLMSEVALSSASILRNHGSARAAAEEPAKGSSGNLGLKTSLREEAGREPEALVEEAAAAIAARVVVVMRRGEVFERAWRRGECAEKLGAGRLWDRCGVIVSDVGGHRNGPVG